MNKKVTVTALMAILVCSLGVAYADSNGFFATNIINSPNAQISTTISNSTAHENANITNSQLSENITLTNSTLTLNINKDSNSNLTVNDLSGNMTLSDPDPPAPTVNVTYLYENEGQNIIQQLNSDVAYTNYSENQQCNYYQFAVKISNQNNSLALDLWVSPSNLTGNPTKVIWQGNNGASLSQALEPLLTQYSLMPLLTNEVYNTTIYTISSYPIWTYTYNGNGEFTFALYSLQQLTPQQTQSLAQNLQTIFQNIIA